MDKIIQIIDTNLPNETNKKIIDLLFLNNQWSFAKDDNDNSLNLNIDDRGLSCVTYTKDNNNFNHNILNIYAGIISDILHSKTNLIKFKNIYRFFWNWYNKNSISHFHQDSKMHNMFSIVYNLHDNDGGTEIKINDKINFYKSNSSQAIVFPSKLWHKGIAPKENKQRFSLNIMVEI
jgi:hypothetical protein